MDLGALFDPSFLLTSLSSVPTLFECGALALAVLVMYAVVQECAALSQPSLGLPYGDDLSDELTPRH